jgi:hypothetical protein
VPVIKAVAYVNIAWSILPFAAGLIFIRRLKPEMRALVGLFGVVAAIEILSLYFGFRRININWVAHFYTPMEYAVFGIVFAAWQANRIWRLLLVISIPLFILFCAWDYVFHSDPLYTNHFTASISCFLYIVITVYTLIVVERQHQGTIVSDFRFWILAGLLIYSAGSIPFFVFFNRFHSYAIWALHNGLNLVANSFYTAGIICQIRRG